MRERRGAVQFAGVSLSQGRDWAPSQAAGPPVGGLGGAARNEPSPLRPGHPWPPSPRGSAATTGDLSLSYSEASRCSPVESGPALRWGRAGGRGCVRNEMSNAASGPAESFYGF